MFNNQYTPLTSQEQTRRQMSGSMAKMNRDQLTRALQGVRMSVQQFVQNSLTETLMTDAAEAVVKLSADRQDGFAFVSSAWHATNPVQTFTYTKQVSTPGATAAAPPVITTETLTETLTYDPAKRFVFRDSTVVGEVVYLHQGGDSPSVYEYLSIVHAFLSYAHHAGEVPAATIQALIGQAPTLASGLSVQLDAWA